MRSAAATVLALFVLLGALSACGRGGGATQATVRGTVTTPLEDTYVFAYKDDQDLYGPAFATAGPTG